MGCDYYIITTLRVTIKPELVQENKRGLLAAWYQNIPLDRDNGYFWPLDHLDSDDDDYEEQCNTANTRDRNLWAKEDKMIFTNGQFVNASVRNKYECHIDKFLASRDWEKVLKVDTVTLADVTTVVKQVYTELRN